MKRDNYLHYAALAFLNHGVQGAAFILLLLVAAGSTASFSFATAYGLTLGVLITAALSLLFGWGLRPKRPIPKNLCWNGAMVLYILNAAAFLLSPEPFVGSVVGTIWSFPIIPALTGAKAVVGGTGAAYLFLGALVCAVEPLCFTLGVTRPVKAKAATGESEADGEAAGEKADEKDGEAVSENDKEK